MIAPSFAQSPEQSVTRAIHLEDQHRIPDVNAELARLFVMQRAFV